MSSVTLFVSKEKKSSVGSFPATLEKLLKDLTNQRHVDVEESTSPNCSPAVILAMRDFGGFGDEKATEIKLKVRELTRQHFGVADQDISVTLNATLML